MSVEMLNGNEWSLLDSRELDVRNKFNSNIEQTKSFVLYVFVPYCCCFIFVSSKSSGNLNGYNVILCGSRLGFFFVTELFFSSRCAAMSPCACK